MDKSVCSIKDNMHKKSPKICTGCRVIAAKIYLYPSTKIAKARPHGIRDLYFDIKPTPGSWYCF